MFMLLAVRVSSYGCTREVGEHERNELLEAQQRVTIASSRTLSMNQFFKVSVHILPISELQLYLSSVMTLYPILHDDIVVLR